ncbi:hypothetical protein [Actinoplanes sp. NPDC023714]|uniref:hypothetical protein n=1 Tax=Actinoplanes sp. NPDC023714 TaxID=3154322 RepID=UPI0033CA253E
MPRLLLAVAVLFAATHALGVLLADPVWRFAELAAWAALLASAVLRGLPAPRWAVPAALGVLLVDAVRTLPAEPNPHGYGWQVLTPGDAGDVTSGFASAVAAWWAPLVAVVLLLVTARSAKGGRVGAAVLAAAVPIVGYALFRVIGIGPDYLAFTAGAVLPAVVLGLAAAGLAAVLVRDGRRPAAAGAVLLAVVALPAIDSGIAATELPYRVSSDPGLFGWDLITPSLAMPQPMPALVAAVTMTAFLLIVAGVSRRSPS